MNKRATTGQRASRQTRQAQPRPRRRQSQGRLGRTDLLLLDVGERILQGLALANPQSRVPGIALVAVEMFRPELQDLLKKQLQPVNKQAKAALNRYHDARQAVEARLQERLVADLRAAAAAADSATDSATEEDEAL